MQCIYLVCNKILVKNQSTLTGDPPAPIGNPPFYGRGGGGQRPLLPSSPPHRHKVAVANGGHENRGNHRSPSSLSLPPLLHHPSSSPSSSMSWAVGGTDLGLRVLVRQIRPGHGARGRGLSSRAVGVGADLCWVAGSGLGDGGFALFEGYEQPAGVSDLLRAPDVCCCPMAGSSGTRWAQGWTCSGAPLYVQLCPCHEVSPLAQRGCCGGVESAAVMVPALAASALCRSCRCCGCLE